MRRIAVITSSRADYGIYRPLLGRLRDHPTVELLVVATGMHLAARFGNTVERIEGDGYELAARVPMLEASDEPEAISVSMGKGTTGFGRVLSSLRPDLMVVLGDRFEMHAAAVAAVPHRIPLAHIHGGELTEGAIDDAFRHSMTKLSHLHFVATEEYGQRVIQMGEEPWRVHVVGALALDNLSGFAPLPVGALSERVGMDLAAGFLLVTLHPVTLEYEHTERYVTELLAALRECAIPVVATRANADTHGSVVNRALEDAAAADRAFTLVDSLGVEAYFSAMTHARAMVGNSSSGILEAPSFGLPVVNIGCRQRGRTRGANVIDVDHDRRSIVDGVRRATSSDFRAVARDAKSPYGGGGAAPRIVDELTSVELGPRLMTKRFWKVR